MINLSDVLSVLPAFHTVFWFFFSPISLHYRVFYTLYLYENAFQATCASLGSVFGQNSTGQQSMMRYR